MTGASGRQRVPANCFDQFMLVVPSAEIAEYFGQLADGVVAKMRVNDGEAHARGAARDARLPRLISGELRVTDAERFLSRSGV